MAVLTKDMVAGLVSTGASARVDADVAPSFKVGDRVTGRNINPVGHTRLPRYVRSRTGVVDRDHGVFSFPDASAEGNEKPQHLYSVVFESGELWGPEATDHFKVYVDMWDDYLEPAE